MSVRLAYCMTANPCGEVKTEHFPSFAAAMNYAKANVPACSAGFTVYLDGIPGTLPDVLHDERRDTA